MASLTTWQRLESLPRSDDLRQSLRAEIADPLWLLARQRQFGELRGEDAGSPVQVRLGAQSARISRLHRGPATGGAAGRAVDIDDASIPLEVAVERESLRDGEVDGGLGAQAGLHFLRLLRVHRATPMVDRYAEHYAFAAEDLPGDDGPTATLRSRVVGRVPDGRRLFTDLDAARGGAAELAALPAEPAIPAAQASKVLAAANDFLAWWEALISEPGDEDPAWQTNHLEHAFAVQADLPDGRVVLHADEYQGGHLDWHAFRASGTPDLGPPATQRPARHVTRTVLPTPVTYGGMPADRFWEIEDGSVRFGDLATGRTDLARLLLAEFALSFGNDWFVVPIDLPVGSVCRIEDLEVTDTFGETTTVDRSTNRGSEAPWRLFELSAGGGPRRVSELLFLPPALSQTAVSPPVENVGLMRDEMANVVWGVERTVQGASGTPIDRYEEHQERMATRQEVEVDFGDAQLLYRLNTEVPYHWHPFVPVRSAGVAPTAGVIQLERRPLVRVLADGTSIAPEPQGRILTAEDPLRVEEEEIQRRGTEVLRTFQLARWTDGRYHLWAGRHRKVGRGEGSSGLRFDIVGPAVR